jgi:integrase
MLNIDTITHCIIDINHAPPGRHFTGVPNLYLQVTPQGQRRYVFRYSRPHKAGVTEMSLGPASQSNWNATLVKLDQLRTQLASGVDPGQHRRQERRQQSLTFAQAAAQYIEWRRGRWDSYSSLQKAELFLKVHAEPLLRLPVHSITVDQVKAAILPLHKRVPKQAKNVLKTWRAVFKYADRVGDNNPADSDRLKLPLQPWAPPSHYLAMPYQIVPLFVAVIRGNTHAVSAMALEVTILTACRGAEVTNATWSEFNRELTEWRIPAKRMKGKRDHVIPLAPRVTQLLKRRREVAVAKRSPYVFFTRNPNKPLEKRALLSHLREQASPETVHGFRASFKTWATEKTKHEREIIEFCLAHVLGDASEEAYWRGTALEKRGKLMNAWATYCLSAVEEDVSDYPDPPDY